METSFDVARNPMYGVARPEILFSFLVVSKRLAHWMLFLVFQDLFISLFIWKGFTNPAGVKSCLLVVPFLLTYSWNFYIIPQPHDQGADPFPSTKHPKITLAMVGTLTPSNFDSFMKHTNPKTMHSFTTILLTSYPSFPSQIHYPLQPKQLTQWQD